MIHEDEEKKKKLKNTIDSVKDMAPSYAQRQIAQETSTKKSEEESLKDVEKKKISGSPSVKSQFLEALTFFTPALLGGLTGAAIEGTEGIAPGIEKGHSLGQDFRKFKMDSAKQKKVDKTSFVDNVTGKPVVEQDGNFVDFAGNVVDPSKVTHAVNFRQTRSLGQRVKEGEGRQQRFQEKLEFDKQKASQLPPAQQTSLEGVRESQLQVQSIDNLLEKVDIGQISSRGQSFQEFFGKADPKFTQLKSQVGFLQQSFRKITTGAQASQEELNELFKLLPKITDEPRTFSSKLNAYKEMVKIKGQAIVEALEAGQPLKRTQLNEIKALLKQGSKRRKSRLSPEDRAELEKLRKMYPNRGKRQ